jgi:hypothetical protein
VGVVATRDVLERETREPLDDRGALDRVGPGEGEVELTGRDPSLRDRCHRVQVIGGECRTVADECLADDPGDAR